MINKLTRDIGRELMDREGEVRGTVFKTDERFILSKGGEDKIREVEARIKELIGRDFKYGAIDPAEFYPIGLRVISILAVAEVFRMVESEIREMGSAAPKVSATVRLFTRYFLSLKKMFEQVSMIWSRHYTEGELEALEMDEKGKSFTLRLNGFKGHPVLCIYLSGYFSKIAEMVINGDVAVNEVECPFNGGDSHTFKAKW